MPVYPGAQWVFSLPKRLRPFLYRDPRLAGDVLRVLLRAIRTTLRRASPPAPGDAQIGAVSFLHRFGSALNAHFHFHLVVLDGVFSRDDDGAVTFHEATYLSADDVHRLQRTMQHRVLRLFQRRGLLDEQTVADMLTWQASGGFSLDASVRVHGSDSAGRERLLRFCARPPFALERLRIERHVEEREQHEQRRATWPPGAAAIRQVLYPSHGPPVTAAPSSPSRLSSFSPPSAVSSCHPASTATATTASSHRTPACANVSSPSAATTPRRPAAPPPAQAAACLTAPARPTPLLSIGPTRRSAPPPAPAGPASSPASTRSSPPLPRLRRPHAPPRLHHRRRTIDAILTHLRLPTSPPPLSPARGPPQHDLGLDADPGFDFDQTPTFDPTEPEPVPDFDFDQSASA